MKKFFNQVISSMKESYAELVHKVSWPTMSELSNSAVVVFSASIVLALVVFVIDFAFEKIMTVIYNQVF